MVSISGRAPLRTFDSPARRASSLAILLAIALFSSSAQAQSIGIDWFGGSAAGTGTGNQTQMLDTDVAGVVPQSNWNSFLGEPASSSGSLVLNNGTASGAMASWTSNNDWDTNIDQAVSANHKLMLGYLDTNDTSISTLQITGLPAAFTSAGYDVYVYYDGDNGTQARAGRYEINGVSQWGQDAASTNFGGTFVLGSTVTDPAPGMTGTQLDNQAAAVATVPAGNYLVFSGLTSADFTLNVQASVSAGGTNRASLNALQIVAIPEPSTMVLLVLGAVGSLLCVARRRLRRA